MSSGKASINYSSKIFDKAYDISVPISPVPEKKYKFKLNENYLDQKLTKCYGKIVNVHSFLLNSEELTNTQKLDFCSIERHFMKVFMKEMMKKV